MRSLLDRSFVADLVPYGWFRIMFQKSAVLVSDTLYDWLSIGRNDFVVEIQFHEAPILLVVARGWRRAPGPKRTSVCLGSSTGWRIISRGSSPSASISLRALSLALKTVLFDLLILEITWVSSFYLLDFNLFCVLVLSIVGKLDPSSESENSRRVPTRVTDSYYRLVIQRVYK
jgi:hypothetical protein